MKIMTYVDLTPAQEETLKAFESVVVRTQLTQPAVVATFQTFHAQCVKVTIDASGVIQELKLSEEGG